MKIYSYSSTKLPSTLKLAMTGAFIGPIVDSLHNQCLLEYNKGQVEFDYHILDNYFVFRSSIFIPPLLAIAYVVLGSILPKAIESILAKHKEQQITNIKFRSLLAVSSTALIIKLSEFLQTDDLPPLPSSTSETHLAIMIIASFLQWLLLDGTTTSLITGIIVSIGGPLSELPFVANDFWTYIPEAADYVPLHDLDFIPVQYKELALSSITGPCYFAVTMDAIALSRLFEEEYASSSESSR